LAEAGPQKRTIEYARSKGFKAHRNYFGPGAEVGWPDVEIFMPSGRVLLIEFKSKNKTPKKIQNHRMDELRAMGFRVATCYTFEEAKAIIDEYSSRN
jgi:Holliday junction resolvase